MYARVLGLTPSLASSSILYTFPWNVMYVFATKFAFLLIFHTDLKDLKDCYAANMKNDNGDNYRLLQEHFIAMRTSHGDETYCL